MINVMNYRWDFEIKYRHLPKNVRDNVKHHYFFEKNGYKEVLVAEGLSSSGDIYKIYYDANKKLPYRIVGKNVGFRCKSYNSIPYNLRKIDRNMAILSITEKYLREKDSSYKERVEMFMVN